MSKVLECLSRQVIRLLNLWESRPMKNPSLEDLIDMQSETYVRALLLPSGDSYCWDPYLGTHDQIARILGLKLDGVIPVTLIVDEDGISIVGITDTVAADRKFAKSQIVNHRYVGLFLSSHHVIMDQHKKAL